LRQLYRLGRCFVGLGGQTIETFRYLAYVLPICYTSGMNIIKLVFYKTETKKEPFSDWASDLDYKTKSIVLERLTRIQTGNFGDCKPIKGYRGIYELVINYGPGYRIYYGKQGSVIVDLPYYA
jgi:putative addiction module killer protein